MQSHSRLQLAQLIVVVIATAAAFTFANCERNCGRVKSIRMYLDCAIAIAITSYVDIYVGCATVFVFGYWYLGYDWSGDDH